MFGQSAMAAASEGRCFLCGAPADEIAWRECGYEAVACRCGLTFVQPPPADAVVNPTHDAHSAAFYRLPAKSKVDWLKGRRAGGTLLEIGCGDGWFLDAAERGGFVARGLDANQSRVAAARARGLDVRLGLLETTAIEERFDVVFHCDLLSHFPEPVGALRSMTRLLTAEGALFFEVGILGGAFRTWYPRIGGIGLPQHRWLYSDAALEKLLADAGLRVVAAKRFGLGPSVWLSHSIRRVAPLARRLMLRPKSNEGPATEVAATAPRRPAWRRYLDDLQERVESFARYEVGALTPEFGPATMLIVAEPQERPE